MPTYVKNVVGTSRRKCRCSYGSRTWLGHWERGTGLVRPLKCQAKFCAYFTQVGAHVYWVGLDKRTIWIVPFCKKHNKRPSNELIELKPGTWLCAAAKVDCA